MKKTTAEPKDESLLALREMAYPGRVIIIGKDPTGENVVVVYSITGRSPSSQARKILFENNRAMVKPTDEALLAHGDAELLIYPAIFAARRVSVSNGRQTPAIHAVWDPEIGPAELLCRALGKWSYEPDFPNFTPRISGCVISPDSAGLSIIKRIRGGGSLKSTFEFPLIPGKGKMIATYTGENTDPLPSFQGEPRDVTLAGVTPRKTAEAIYAALGPAQSEQDFRVATACVFIRDLEHEIFAKAVINRHERTHHEQDR
jgi:IMP cyclohydrolase